MDVFAEVEVLKTKDLDASGADKRLRKKFLADGKVTSSLSDDTRSRSLLRILLLLGLLRLYYM